MYNVNIAQIERRLAYVDTIAEAAQRVQSSDLHELVAAFAAERAVHLAAECVTDVGNYIIDGFVMRDASSYEDIVDILHGESVFDEMLYPFLVGIVRMRKPLVQDYDRVDRAEVERLIGLLPQGMLQFKEAIRSYLKQELR